MLYVDIVVKDHRLLCNRTLPYNYETINKYAPLL